MRKQKHFRILCIMTMCAFSLLLNGCKTKDTQDSNVMIEQAEAEKDIPEEDVETKPKYNLVEGDREEVEALKENNSNQYQSYSRLEQLINKITSETE